MGEGPSLRVRVALGPHGDELFATAEERERAEREARERAIAERDALQRELDALRASRRDE